MCVLSLFMKKEVTAFYNSKTWDEDFGGGPPMIMTSTRTRK